MLVITRLLPLRPFFVAETNIVQGGLDECLIDILTDEDDWRLFIVTELVNHLRSWRPVS